MHEGRFQIHGKKSVLINKEPWHLEEPLTALTGHIFLSGLSYRAPSGEVAILSEAFLKTHDLIDRVAKHGGHGPYKWSWPKPSRKDQRRVDTEISRGRAFV